MTTFVHPPRRSAWVALVALLAAAGCGSEKPTGTVAGKVTCNGAVVPSGNVNLISTTGAAAMAKITEAGTFHVDGPLPTGDYRVYLSAPIPEPLPPGQKQPKVPKFEVPAKFTDPATTKVTITVKPGANDLPIEFKD